VLSVILAHTSYGFFYGGFLGVDLFFVLSGYLITGLLINEYTGTRTIRLDFFYLRRVCRLVPALVAACGLAFLCGHFFYPTDPVYQLGWFGVLVILLGVANFFLTSTGLLGVTWSLAVEEQFYWLWPVILRYLLKLRSGTLLLPTIFLFIFLAAGLRAWLKWHGADPQFVYMFTATRIDSLFVGALAVVVSTHVNVRTTMGWLSRFRAPELILVAWALLLYWINSSSTFLSYGGSTAIALVFAVFLLCITQQGHKTWLVLVLESGCARWLGKRSYGIYLYHVPVVTVLELYRVPHSPINLALITALRFAIPIVLAALSYRYIEMPFLRWKSKLHGEQNA